MREFSIYKGVSYDEPNGQWIAKWGDKHLGFYREEKFAAEAVEFHVNKILN